MRSFQEISYFIMGKTWSFVLSKWYIIAPFGIVPNQSIEGMLIQIDQKRGALSGVIRVIEGITQRVKGVFRIVFRHEKGGCIIDKIVTFRLYTTVQGYKISIYIVDQSFRCTHI